MKRYSVAIALLAVLFVMSSIVPPSFQLEYEITRPTYQKRYFGLGYPEVFGLGSGFLDWYVSKPPYFSCMKLYMDTGTIVNRDDNYLFLRDQLIPLFNQLDMALYLRICTQVYDDLTQRQQVINVLKELAGQPCLKKGYFQHDWEFGTWKDGRLWYNNKPPVEDYKTYWYDWWWDQLKAIDPDYIYMTDRVYGLSELNRINIDGTPWFLWDSGNNSPSTNEDLHAYPSVDDPLLNFMGCGHGVWQYGSKNNWEDPNWYGYGDYWINLNFDAYDSLTGTGSAAANKMPHLIYAMETCFYPGWEFQGYTPEFEALIRNLMWDNISTRLDTYAVNLNYQGGPTPTKYTLTVNSNPSGISFSLDGASRTTPYSDELSEGSHTVVMPSTTVVSGVTYSFVQWNDATTNPRKTVNLLSDMTLTATYIESSEPPPPENTFGKTTIGAVEDYNAVQYKEGSRYQLTESTHVQSIIAYVRGASQMMMKCAIYSDNNGAPNRRLAVTNEVLVTTSYAWVEFPFSSSVSLTPGWYWLCIRSSSGTFYYMQDAVTENHKAYNKDSGFSDPFGTPTYERREMSIYAVYSKEPTYNLTITVTMGGITNPTPGVRTYDEGTKVEITAYPDFGYFLDHWELDSINVGVNNPYSVTMNSDHNLHAVFATVPPVTHDLVISSTVGGTTNPSPDTHTYNEGANVTVTAIPDADYLFEHWELDGAEVGNENPYYIIMDKDHTIHAVFSFTPRSTITGTITDSLTGEPISGANVTANGYSNTSNPDGSYFLQIFPEAYALTVTAPGYEFWSDHVDVSVAGTYVVDVALTSIHEAELRYTFLVAIRVKDSATDLLVKGASVYVRNDTWSSKKKYTDERGWVNFTDLESGTYVVIGSAEGYATALETVSVTTNATYTLTLEKSTPTAAPINVPVEFISIMVATSIGVIGYFMVRHKFAKKKQNINW